MWSRKKKPQEIPPPDKKGRQIHPSNRPVLWGTEFRTCRFRPDGGSGVDYLQAEKQPDGTWTIFRISSVYFGDNREEILRSSQKSGLGFFDAVDYLAMYEVTATDMDRHRVDPDEKEKLGLQHYEAFARREGMVFDLDGLPHETRDGKVVTEGRFGGKEIDAAKAVHNENAQKLKKLFDENAAAGNNGQELVRAVLPLAERASIDDVLATMENRQTVIELNKSLQKIVEHWNVCLSRGFEAYVRRETRYRPGYYHHRRGSYDNSYEVTISTADEVIAAIEATQKTISQKLRGTDTGFLERGLQACRLAFDISRAQHALSLKVDRMTEDQIKVSTIRQMVTEAREKFTALGMPDADLIRLEAAIMGGLFEAPAGIPEPVMEFVQKVRDLEDQLLAQARTAARPAVYLPPPTLKK